ncbi:hypothetical protein K435DRAFT_786141 [Dendrothele bispora CBS 962.96]|uniref:DUF6533 domain-containing protein n=1 Tax=Dendrothele bispora (strain CBS 962.96) TaxID=1314807 RepID=A0A4S8KSL9_DENBC|nr:hypothetical protein K435DRAFT_786141 [Dendrothele bispora CBS 962.96]
MGEISPWWIVTAMIAPSIFLLYDHLLMLGMEIQYIWVKRKRRSAYWFLLLRYLASTGEIIILVFRFSKAGSESRCLGLQSYINAQTLFVELLVALLMSMRVYAIYECSQRIMWFMIAVAGTMIPVIIWSVVKSSIGTVLLQGMICGTFFPEQRASYLTITWACAFAYDLMIFSLTAWKTYQSRRSYPGPISVRIPLLEMMLRDGVVYFGIMTVVHLANLVLCATRSSSMSALVRDISAGMTLRLMLNLHTSASEGLLAEMKLTNLTRTPISGSRATGVNSSLVFRSPSPDTDFTTLSLNERNDRPHAEPENSTGNIEVLATRTT